MSYVPAKLREIFQTCRLRPENIADRGALSARRPKIGASVPSLPAGARRRRREPPRDASRAEARRFGRFPRPLPSAENSVRTFFSEKEPERIAGRECRESAVRLAGRSRWIGGLFSIEKSSGAKPIRSPAGASAAYVRERRKSQGLRGSRPRRFSREAGGSSNAASPRRFREVPAARQGKDAGVFPRFRLIGKGRAGAVRRVADDADGSFTNGSNRESPATGPASGRGTGWG